MTPAEYAAQQSLIASEWKEQMHKYITGLVQNHNHKMIAINSMPDHLHMFFGFRPNQSLSDLMRLVKGESSEWINKKQFTPAAFRWQEGYGAFSYSKSHVDDVIRYIQNQDKHHEKESFLQEYRKFLDVFGVEWQEKYIFREPE